MLATGRQFVALPLVKERRAMHASPTPPRFDWTDGLATVAVLLWLLMIAAMIAYAAT
jgi:hypothetical protein